MSISEPNIERLVTAFQRRKYDRTPNFEQIVDPIPVRNIMGWGEDRYEYSVDLAPADAIVFAKKTCQDAITANISFIPGEGGSVSSKEDTDKIIMPDPERCRNHVKSYLSAVNGTNIGVGLRLNGPFFMAYWVMGPVPIQSFMLNVYDDLPFVEYLMDFQLKHQIKMLEAVLDLPVSFILISDDVATSTGYFINPDLMKKLWMPREEMLMKVAKKMNVPVVFHCCGKLDQVIPNLIRWGVDAVHPIQPSCNDIYSLKKQWGNYLSFIGNMSIEGVLAFGSQDEIISDTREHIDRLSYDGGYVVASSHSITDAIPIQNYYTMIDAAIKYGKY
jgi:uroporphyrinogen decarboxylase